MAEAPRQGIGRELVRRILERLDGLYMVDLLCEPDLVPFYAALGMNRATAMARPSLRGPSGSVTAKPGRIRHISRQFHPQPTGGPVARSRRRRAFGSCTRGGSLREDLAAMTAQVIVD